MKRSTEHRADPSSRTCGGFTLLEVLAAVAILGIWYAVLASVAIQGVRAEGENERRVRASLIADEVLDDLETEMDEGTFPELGVAETERDSFRIEVETAPIAESGLATDFDLFALLSGEAAEGLMRDLLAIEVRVVWKEGVDDKVIRRITYAWNSTTLTEALQNQPEGGDEDPDEGAPAGLEELLP